MAETGRHGERISEISTDAERAQPPASLTSESISDAVEHAERPSPRSTDMSDSSDSRTSFLSDEPTSGTETARPDSGHGKYALSTESSWQDDTGDEIMTAAERPSSDEQRVGEAVTPLAVERPVTDEQEHDQGDTHVETGEATEEASNGADEVLEDVQTNRQESDGADVHTETTPESEADDASLDERSEQTDLEVEQRGRLVPDGDGGYDFRSDVTAGTEVVDEEDPASADVQPESGDEEVEQNPAGLENENVNAADQAGTVPYSDAVTELTPMSDNREATEGKPLDTDPQPPAHERMTAEHLATDAPVVESTVVDPEPVPAETETDPTELLGDTAHLQPVTEKVHHDGSPREPGEGDGAADIRQRPGIEWLDTTDVRKEPENKGSKQGRPVPLKKRVAEATLAMAVGLLVAPGAAVTQGYKNVQAEARKTSAVKSLVMRRVFKRQAFRVSFDGGHVDVWAKDKEAAERKVAAPISWKTLYTHIRWNNIGARLRAAWNKN